MCNTAETGSAFSIVDVILNSWKTSLQIILKIQYLAISHFFDFIHTVSSV